MQRRQFLRGAIAATGAGVLGPMLGSALFAPAEAETVDLVSGTVTRRGPLVVPAGTTLSFNPWVSTTLTVDCGNSEQGAGDQGVVVYGTLDMRPAAGVVHTLRFAGTWTEARMTGASTSSTSQPICELGQSHEGTELVPSDIGLWVRGAGRLLLQGRPRTRRARLAGGASAGAESITLDAVPQGWRAGDRLSICPTLPSDKRGWYAAFDDVVIASITGATVRLVSALTTDHPVAMVGGLPRPAEVLNLSADVVIAGGGPTQRAHVHVCCPDTPSQHVVSHAAFVDLGPRRPLGAPILGRYPFHLHLLGDRSRGLVVDGCVVTRSGSHAFVPHGSHGVTLRDCVAHDVAESAYWWDEDGRSDDVTFDRCTAAKGRAADGRGYSMGMFTLGATRGSTAVGCVAVGLDAGVTSSGFTWPHFANDAPGAWAVTDCVSHNHRSEGFYVWSNRTGSPSSVVNAVAYANGDCGVQHGAYTNLISFRGGVLVGNGGAGLTGQGGDPARCAPLVLTVVNNSGAPLVALRDVVLDGSGLAKALVRRLNGPLDATAPYQLVGCTFLGLADKGSVFDIAEGVERGKCSTWIDVVAAKVGPAGRDLLPTDVALTSPAPGFKLRYQSQDGTRAWKLNAKGVVTPIAPFFAPGG